MDGPMNNEGLFHLNCPHCGEFISFNRPESTDETFVTASNLGKIKLDNLYSIVGTEGCYESVNAEMVCNRCYYTFKTIARRNFDLR